MFRKTCAFLPQKQTIVWVFYFASLSMLSMKKKEHEKAYEALLLLKTELVLQVAKSSGFRCTLKFHEVAA